MMNAWARTAKTVLQACAAAGLLVSPASPVGAATLEVAATFSDATGDAPAGGLLLASDGIMYGTTRYGGTAGSGNIFRFNPVSGELVSLASLTGGAGGESPQAGLYRDTNGALYGTTLFGGQSGVGTVFRLDPGASSVTTITSFVPAQGASVLGPLVSDGAGSFYGTAAYGGANAVPPYYGGDGTLFRLNGSSLSVSSQFGGAAGVRPNGDLLRAADGSLYGTTSSGGANGGGTLFRLAPGADAVTTLFAFDGANGASPSAGVISDASGNLYGTTSVGGTYGRGTIFQYNIAAGTLITLASIDASIGNGSEGPLLVDAAGNLFGTSSDGGPDNEGTIFRLDAGSSLITTLAAFDQSTGYDPETGLVADAFGNLYGTTFSGGANYNGTIFRLRDAGFVTAAASLPEPSGWAMMIIGVGAVGTTLRRRRRLGHLASIPISA